MKEVNIPMTCVRLFGNTHKKHEIMLRVVVVLFVLGGSIVNYIRIKIRV